MNTVTRNRKAGRTRANARNLLRRIERLRLTLSGIPSAVRIGADGAFAIAIILLTVFA